MSGGFGPWKTMKGGSSGGGVTAVGPVGSSPNANAAVISGSTLTLEPADATHPGVLSTAAQTIAGAKWFSGGLSDSAASPSVNTDTRFLISPIGTNVLDWANQFLLSDSSTTALDWANRLLINASNSPSLDWNNNQLFGNWVAVGFEASDIVIDATSFVGGVATFASNVAFSFASTLTPSGTTQTVNWTLGSSQKISLASASGNVTLTLSNPVAGGRYLIEVVQGASARNLVWPAAVKWPGGVAPVITVTNGKTDKIKLDYDGTNYLGEFAQNY